MVTLHFMKVTHSLKISAFYTHTHTVYLYVILLSQ